MYPTISEYLEAIKSAEDNFDQLKHLRPVLDDDGQPVMTSGNFAVVFKMKDEKTGKFHAVKCFLREQEGRAEAYRQIAEELEYVSSTFLTPIKYLDKELFVDTSNSEESEFPVLLMDWVEGQTLDKYIREHIDDQYELSLLAYQFSRLAMWLMPQPFAHGDLKPDNILVKDDGTLVLVDYDGMYVPAMKGQNARELGSPDFRHPGRTEDVFDEHIDDFSLVSILLSLKAIALQPDLLEQYGASDRLLFSANDYRNLSESQAMDALKTMMQDTELATLYSLFILSSAQNNLSQTSFRLLNLSRPKEPEYENLSTEVTDEDLANAWTDEFGVKYSSDRKRLLKAPAEIVHYSVKAGTKVICNEAFYNIITKFDNRAFLKYGGNEDNYYSEEPASDLESIFIPQSVSVIGNNAFLWCCNLKKIDLRNGIKQIGDSAFGCCCSIKSLDLPNNLEVIGDSSFEDCGYLESIIVPNTVKSIGKSAFAKCKKLESVILSEKIETIEPSTFRGCVGIKSVKIPNNVKFIGEFAFQRCSSLTTIAFPEKLIGIGKRAFNLCYSLLSITIPCNLNEIGEDAFLGCTGLISILVDKRNAYFNSRENCNAIIETNNECLVLACKNTLIPNGVSIIGRNAFSLIKDINSIVLPDTITEIKFAAFSGCENLSSINIPKSLNFIGDAAFYGCKRLVSQILINNNVINERLSDICDCLTNVSNEDLANALVDEYGVKYSWDKRRLLKAPPNLNNYSINRETIVICDNAFNSCEQLQHIIIPDEVILIGGCAFDGCIMLNSVKLPPEIKSIRGGTFRYCSSLESITIPDKVSEIGIWAFYSCKKLLEVNFPPFLTKMGDGVFGYCENLLSIELPDTLESMGQQVFEKCQGLKSVAISKKLKYISAETFAGCTNLKSIVIPEGVKRIYGGVFSGCSSMQSVILPNSLEEIFHNVDLDTVKPFLNCISLKEIIIPIGTRTKFEKLLSDYKDILKEKVTVDNHNGLRRIFCKKELEVVNRAKVVQGQYTKLVCFYMNDGCQKYIPLCKQSQLSIGDEVDLNKAKLIELSGEGIFYGYIDGREYYDNNLVDA